MPRAALATRLRPPLSDRCVVELFTFLRMGGAPESILVYRLSLDSKLGKTLGKFDALKAKCYYSRDREKLLAVVEAGFGDVRPFNKQVRHILDANVEATSAALPMAAAGSGGSCSGLPPHSVSKLGRVEPDANAAVQAV